LPVDQVEAAFVFAVNTVNSFVAAVTDRNTRSGVCFTVSHGRERPGPDASFLTYQNRSDMSENLSY
jgi:hypothetical protein